jgi:hypothetical protein
MCNMQAELYHQLVRVTMKKQDEVKKIIQDTLASEAEKIITNAGNLDLTGLFYLHFVGSLMYCCFC